MGTAVGAEESLDESIKGLTWSLRSIWIWMRIIGIELEQSKIYSPLCRRLSLAIGFWWVSVNLSSHVASFVFLKQNLNEESGNDTTSTIFSGIESASFSINAVAIHLALLFIMYKKWINLWSAICRMETQILLKSEAYRFLRTCAVGGVLYIVVVNGVLGFLTTRHHLSRSNHSSLLMTMDLLNLVTQIYPTSAMMLFCILGLAVSMNYRAIYEAVREFRRENVIEIESVESTTTQLQVWKRNHALVCDVAEELSNCFGVILLIKVGYLFISIINSAIFLMIGITDVESEAEITMYIAFSIEHVVHLFMICYVADQIRYEGLKINRSLRKFWVTTAIHERQINFLMAQVYQGVPEISALGFFQIGQHLFPTVIGSTITYLVILYELRSSGGK